MRPCCPLHAGPDLMDNASLSLRGGGGGDCPSVTTTCTVDDNFRSHASSQASIPALDWDEQVRSESAATAAVVVAPEKDL